MPTTRCAPSAIRCNYNGETAARRADLGEAIAAAAGGVVTAEAKAEFERALALDAGEVKARYFTAVAAQQDGKTEQAAAIWRDMLKTAPRDAPWRPLVERALAQIGVAAPEIVRRRRRRSRTT